MAKKRRSRGMRGAGAIDQLPGGRWRLRVPLDTGGRATYGTYVTEELAVVAQSRWNLTHLLPADDPEQAVELPASVAVGGVRCDEWFLRWQEAKKARRSRVRVNKKRGGAESTAARDRACWSKWWAPVLGSRLPHTVTQRDIMAVIDSMEKAGLAPLTIKTHWSVIKAFFGWLFEEDVLTVSPIAKAWVSADAVAGQGARHRRPGLPVHRHAVHQVGDGSGPRCLRALVGHRRSSLRSGGNDGRRCRPPGQAGMGPPTGR